MIFRSILFVFQITELYNSLSTDSGIGFRIVVTGFKKGSIIVEFVIFLESFEKEKTDEELKNIFSQQLAGQDGQILLGEFTLDSNFTRFSGMLSMN